jgi:putative ABC transport system substrate-binding protein
MEAAADALGVKVIPSPYRSAAELEHVIDTFAAEPNGALVLMPPPPRGINRELFKRLALQHRLPAIGANRYDTADEVVMVSYGADSIEVVRAAASYVDRILRGAKISELPVQFPTKFELIINLKTAATMGLMIPESLLFRADEVIK